MADTDLERLFLDNLALIDRIVASTCRRNRLTKEESEDFASVVKLKLLADDYAVLRKFTGNCKATLRGYLIAVVQHAYQDHRNHLWGKWRPSAEARRLGPLATKLDTLLHRDGLTLDEACALADPADREEMQRLASKLAPRAKRRMEDVQQLERLPSGDRTPEAVLIDRERDAVLEALGRVLAEALEGLKAEDKLLLHLRLERRLSLASVAKAYGVDARKLYRQWELLIKQLRARLEKSGYGPGQVAWILDPGSAGGGGAGAES
ncbi:MAG TPA: sigma-70 family RNA polymerase sigma factor [Thermoanaerobaculia bacterium]|jgi:RNA polymerase sigma factor (sigma-70 family)|nr:sigma-70 family RNA polymerase sigma factor [Thermoanaerobaculia bacterium]